MTSQDITTIVNGLRDALEPGLRETVIREIEGRVKTEAYKLLDSLVGSELREMVRKQVQGNVDVEVSVKG